MREDKDRYPVIKISHTGSKKIFGVDRVVLFFVAQFVAFLLMIAGFLIFTFLWYLNNT